MENKSWLLLVSCLILCSCGPRWHLSRAEKHIEKAKSLGSKWKSDTVFQETFIPVPEVVHDTTFVITEAQTDTFTIEKERLRVKIVRRVDTLRVEAECLPDTIRIETPVVVNREITAPKSYWIIWRVAGLALMFLVAGFILGKVLK